MITPCGRCIIPLGLLTPVEFEPKQKLPSREPPIWRSSLREMPAFLPFGITKVAQSPALKCALLDSEKGQPMFYGSKCLLR